MLSTYNRSKLSSMNSGAELYTYVNSHDKTGLEWNQYIGRIIINDFIKQLSQYDGADFAEYMPVLMYIEYGLFQSAINVIKKIDMPQIGPAKEWLLKALEEGEDRYE